MDHTLNPRYDISLILQCNGGSVGAERSLEEFVGLVACGKHVRMVHGGPLVAYNEEYNFDTRAMMKSCNLRANAIRKCVKECTVMYVLIVGCPSH